MGFIKRFLAGGVILLVVPVIFYMTGGATADAAALEAETPSGPAGSPVLVTGDEYLTLVPVGICWNRPGCSDLGSAQPGLLDDSFSTEILIPDTATPGQYVIHACQLLSTESTCSSATFEVLGAEPTTTTTLAPTTTTTPPPPTTTLQPTTTLPSTKTTESEPETTTTPAETEPSDADAPDEESEEEPEATRVVSVSSSDPPTSPATPEETTTTTLSSETPPERDIYTPPTISSPAPSQPEAETRLPTVTLQASDEVPSPLSWLDDPLLFWASWLVAVMMGGALASAFAWLIRRRRRAG